MTRLRRPCAETVAAATVSAHEHDEARALFRVVRGEPTDVEVAALTVVLAAVGSDDDDPAPATRDAWSDPAARIRTPLSAGPGAWRATYLPR